MAYTAFATCEIAEIPGIEVRNNTISISTQPNMTNTRATKPHVDIGNSGESLLLTHVVRRALAVSTQPRLGPL